MLKANRFIALKSSLFIVIIFSSQLSFAQSGEKNFIDLNYIEVVGKAELEVSPNLIYIRVLLNEKDNKNKTPIQELEKQMINQLRSLGIDLSKDLIVKDISSNFKSYFLSKNDILLSKEFQITARDAKTAGKIFVELEKVGISNISIARLDHSNIMEYRKEVKINAVKAAKEKANFLATAIEQTIGKAVFIQEQVLNYRPNAQSNSMEYKRDWEWPASIELDIDFEKIKLEYTVLCRFELK